MGVYPIYVSLGVYGVMSRGVGPSRNRGAVGRPPVYVCPYPRMVVLRYPSIPGVPPVIPGVPVI